MTANTMEADPGFFSPQVMTGTRDLQVYPLYGEAKYSGTISAPMFPSQGIQMLVAAIGTDVVSGTAAPFTHTISEATLASQVEGLTIEKNVGNFQSLQFAGSRVGKASIKCQVGNQPVTCDYDVESSLVNILTTPTAVSILNEQPYVFAEGALTWLTHNRLEVSNVQLDIDNMPLGTYTLDGLHGPAFLSNVALHVSGQLDLVWSSFSDATFGDYTTMVNGTFGALVFSLTHPASAGTITITLPKVALSKFANDLKIADVVMTTLNYEAVKDAGATNKTISAVILNSVSTSY